MSLYKIKNLNHIKETISIPPDKSISHRALMLASIAEGKTIINPFLQSDDTLATLECLERLGVKIVPKTNGSLEVEGKGKYFPKNEKVVLDAKESGTTMRILSGLLCAQKFPVVFNASPALSKRPMRRIIEPLCQMNAKITGVPKTLPEVGAKENIYPPLAFQPADKINGGNFNLPIASAQVKSAIILASLYADNSTTVCEPYQSRNHTELMLKLFGVDLDIEDKKIICNPDQKLKSPGEIFIPSDFSSAAFFIVLGLVLKNSEIRLKDISLNPTRCGLLRILEKMGADITIQDKKDYFEPYGDIVVKSSKLRAPTESIGPEEIPSMIDEVPILAVAAAFAEGTTVIRGIKELTVKETDRVRSICSNLKNAGVKVSAAIKDTLEITGCSSFKQTVFQSFSDHRTAMSAIVLGTSSGAACEIDEIKSINKSFPEFISLFESLTK